MRAFHHFVIHNVYTGLFTIDSKNTLSSVIRMCYTVNKSGSLRGNLRETVCAGWFRSWRDLNQEYALIDGLHMTTIINHASNRYQEAVENYLVYGL